MRGCVSRAGHARHWDEEVVLVGQRLHLQADTLGAGSVGGSEEHRKPEEPRQALCVFTCPPWRHPHGLMPHKVCSELPPLTHLWITLSM